MKTIKLFVDMESTLTRFQPIKSIEDLWKENYFKNLKPINNVVHTVNHFLEDTEKDVEVYILTSCIDSKYAKKEKIEWINYYIPSIDKEHIIYTDYGIEKNNVINKIDKSCVLLDHDDYRLKKWKEKGGIGIQLIYSEDENNIWDGQKLDFSLNPSIMYYTIKRMIIEEFIQKRTIKEMLEMTENNVLF